MGVEMNKEAGGRQQTMRFVRVLVEHAEGGWTAQGLEIDYMAAGTDAEDVISRFEKGIEQTAREHHRQHASVDAMLKVAPQEAWTKWANGSRTPARWERTASRCPVLSDKARIEAFAYIMPDRRQ